MLPAAKVPAIVPALPAMPQAVGLTISKPPVLSFRTTEETSALDFVILVGLAHSGKTTSALTFPNPYVVNGENKVPKGAKSFDFFDDDFVNSIIRPTGKIPNRRDAFENWLANYAPQLPEDATLIIDSLSSLDYWFHQQTEDVEQTADLRQIYGRKLKYFCNVFETLKRLPCRIIVTAHMQPIYETPSPGKPEQHTGKYKAFIGGSFAEKISTYATSTLRNYISTDPALVKAKQQYRWRLRPDAFYDTNLFTDRPIEETDCLATYATLSAIVQAAEHQTKP